MKRPIQNKRGSRISAKVTRFDDDKIYMSLAEGVEGYLPQKDFQNSNSDSTLEEGLEMEVVIANLGKKDREIILSLRALEKAEEREALQEQDRINKEIEDSSKSNIGDLIKAKLDDNPEDE